MFDRTYITPAARAGSQYVTVTEKRAPTDESVRLLKEMEGEARNKLIESVRVTGSNFEMVVHFEKDFASDENVYRAITAINGTRVVLEHRAGRGDSPREAVCSLREALATEIAQRILEPAFMQLLSQSKFG